MVGVCVGGRGWMRTGREGWEESIEPLIGLHVLGSEEPGRRIGSDQTHVLKIHLKGQRWNRGGGGQKGWSGSGGHEEISLEGLSAAPAQCTPSANAGTASQKPGCVQA